MCLCCDTIQIFLDKPRCTVIASDSDQMLAHRWLCCYHLTIFFFIAACTLGIQIGESDSSVAMKWFLKTNTPVLVHLAFLIVFEWNATFYANSLKSFLLQKCSIYKRSIYVMVYKTVVKLSVWLGFPKVVL